MLIELATSADAQEILDLQKLAYLSEAAIYNDYSIPPLTQTLEQIQADFQQQIFFKSVLDGRIVGSVRGSLRDDTCYIGRLIVHPDFQNQGLGTRLMQAIEGRFAHAKRYELFTGEHSARNLHLYHKLGYHVLRTEELTGKVKIVFMEKQNQS